MLLAITDNVTSLRDLLNRNSLTVLTPVPLDAREDGKTLKLVEMPAACV